MATKHPDAPAIDRLGTKILKDHFQISRQTVSHWRKSGVPKSYRKPMALLGRTIGYQMPEMDAERSSPSVS